MCRLAVIKMAVAAAVLATKAFEVALKGLVYKNDVRKNVMQVRGNMKETFKIRVESPEALILRIHKSGTIKLSLVRSGAFTAHVEGTVSHISSKSQEVVFQRSYRSDKGGCEMSLSVQDGDVISIAMEAHHFVSAVIGQGSSEMELNLQYQVNVSRQA